MLTIMIIMAKMANKKGIAEEVTVAAAKDRFSELLGRVAFGGETVLITRRGRPMAKLVPPNSGEAPAHLADLTGWLDDRHPLFGVLDDMVERRSQHLPRVLKQARQIRR